jgi:hypothetical protein
MTALAAADATVTVIGHPGGRWMPDRYPDLIDRWYDLPHWPSIIECGGTRRETAAFLAAVREDVGPVDVALQLHGSGGPINWLGVALGARTVAVHTTPDRLGPWRCTRPWPDRGHESERLADLAAEAGFPTVDTRLEFPVHPADRREAEAIVPSTSYVVVHPGASRADRRWSADGFGAVAAAMARTGRGVLVTAGPGEHHVAAAVQRCANASGGRALVAEGLSLGALAAVLERCDAVVANDTGVAHLAVAVGAPTVVVGTTSDLDRWGPRDRSANRVVQTRGRNDEDVDRVVSSVREVARAVTAR